MGTLDKVFNIAGAIVILAGVATVVSSPRTASILEAVFGGFARTINAATAPARR